mmetsp:Transcript_9769/g.24847  ORF Transcript_9769/g.24847 Transcript_9769/m.24847 type:complete len:214 (-) Transcript_9769:9834-10475(-)
MYGRVYLKFHGEREHKGVEIPLHHLWPLAHQPVQHRHLRGVLQVHNVQRPDVAELGWHLRAGLLRLFHLILLGHQDLAGVQPRDAAGLLAAQAAAGALHPVLVHHSGGPLAVLPGLVRHALPQAAQRPLEVALAEPLVTVRQDAEANDDVREGELRGGAGHVLTHKGHCTELARARDHHALRGRPGEIRGAEQPILHSVDLGDAVGDEAPQPV